MTTRRRDRTPRLTYLSAIDPDACWTATDAFLRSVPALKPLRRKVAKLIDELREIADYGLAERIDSANNELCAEILAATVVWAFDCGLAEGQRLAADAQVTDEAASRARGGAALRRRGREPRPDRRRGRQ